MIGVDGSSIVLTVIEGGMEMQVVPASGLARKTTFTFMTDRMGTVVDDGGSSSAGSSVTGFFRLTGKGVEVRYADGRSAMLSATPDSGVQMMLDGDEGPTGPTCHAWYPTGHQFSDLEKKAALSAFASKLGLPVMAADMSNGCAVAPVAKPASLAPSGNIAPAAPTPRTAARAKADRKSEARNDVKIPVRMAKASYHVGDYQAAKELETVTVKPSDVHAIDSSLNGLAISAPDIDERGAGNRNDASRCLKVDSDGSHWGFRNNCDFAVQFAYCMAEGSDNLTACGSNNVVTTSATGSVAARGFGALMSDTSLADKDASHKFRWIACGGGAGEVAAHLDRADPPAGRCEKAQTAAK